MREVTRRILSRNGYRVLVAASGREAMELAANQPGDIDILLTDVVMPQMLGREARGEDRRAAARREGALHVRLHPGRSLTPRASSSLAST